MSPASAGQQNKSVTNSWLDRQIDRRWRSDPCVSLLIAGYTKMKTHEILCAFSKASVTQKTLGKKGLGLRSRWVRFYTYAFPSTDRSVFLITFVRFDRRVPCKTYLSLTNSTAMGVLVSEQLIYLHWTVLCKNFLQSFNSFCNECPILTLICRGPKPDREMRPNEIQHSCNVLATSITWRMFCHIKLLYSYKKTCQTFTVM